MPLSAELAIAQITNNQFLLSFACLIYENLFTVKLFQGLASKIVNKNR